jgi:hypothetical protein
MLCFFRSLIDFDWIEGHLISDRIGSGRVRVRSDQIDFLKKLGSSSDPNPNESDEFLESGRVLPSLIFININKHININKSKKIKLLLSNPINLVPISLPTRFKIAAASLNYSISSARIYNNIKYLNTSMCIIQ